MSSKVPVAPVWWKNTFFVFGILLVLLSVFGLVKGEQAIRDPGQKFETGLVVFYFLGGVAMLVNGWLTHSQSVQQHEEYVEVHGASTKDSKKDGLKDKASADKPVEEENNG